MNMARKDLQAVKAAGSIDWTGLKTRHVDDQAGTTIFAQGDAATSVMFVDDRNIRLSVLSQSGKEAVVTVLERWHFFGEGCLVGQPYRMATATAIAPSTIVVVEKQDMVRQLHDQPAFAERFLTHMLTRNIRIEEDLIDGHPLERRFQTLDSRAHGLHHRVSRTVGRHSSLLTERGEMSEWSIEHAWESDLFTRADADRIPPTHFRSTTSTGPRVWMGL